MFRIEMLEAAEGDALWIEVGDAAERRTLLVDTGRKETYRTLADRISRLARPLDLLVITHIDDDHIFGAVPLLADSRSRGQFRDVWFNGYRHLFRQAPGDFLGPLNGEFFSALLVDHQYPWNQDFGDRSVVVPDQGGLPTVALGGTTITLLSPTWTALENLRGFWEQKLEGLRPGNLEEALKRFSETARVQPDLLGGSGRLDVEGLLLRRYESDRTEPNGSSIAFLVEFDGRAALFGADAHSPVLETSLRRLLASRGKSRLRLDAFKVSHHGSRSNTSPELLELIDCSRFLFSTNGKRHHHPDRETIARILYRNRKRPGRTELYFNFRTEENEVWDDQGLKSRWNYQSFYPPQGSVVDL